VAVVGLSAGPNGDRSHGQNGRNGRAAGSGGPSWVRHDIRHGTIHVPRWSATARVDRARGVRPPSRAIRKGDINA
jgi:hypothetical protein